MAGCLSIFAALLDFSCIFGGPDWYRFFCAGEKMAQMSTACDTYPTIVTFFIASILSVWGLYAFSGTRLISKLSLLKKCFALITAVFNSCCGWFNFSFLRQIP
jgi:putative oxidoreductase